MDSHDLTKEHFFAECKNNPDEHSRSGSDRDHRNIHNSGSGSLIFENSGFGLDTDQ